LFLMCNDYEELHFVEGGAPQHFALNGRA